MKSKMDDIVRGKDVSDSFLSRHFHFKKDAEYSIQINESVVLHTMLVLMFVL